MKKFLAVALLILLVASVFAVASTAAEAPTYWSISSDCYVKVRTLDDGTVPTFKCVENDDGVDGLIVGVPANAVVGDDYFQAKDGYEIGYIDEFGYDLTSDSDHIGTSDRIVVYSSTKVVAEYALVTYGDADGDGYFDVIDAAFAARCLSGMVSAEESPALYEAVKPRVGFDNKEVEAEDYQQIVNDSIKDESLREENIKGRKTPVDDTIGFESVLYTNNGSARAAAATIKDNNFKSLVTIKYNGSTTAPSASGIYAVTATVADSEKYLVTPGERELGFIVIAPKDSTGYKVSVDNASKKVIVKINNFNTSDATFDGYISGWYNSAYNLKIGSSAISSGTAAVSALPTRAVNQYTLAAKNVTIASTADVLGGYLPDDYTLWNNEEASNSVAVSVDKNNCSYGFSLEIKQDKDAINVLEQTFLTTLVNAARGQRFDNPATSSNASGLLGRTTKKVYVEAKYKYNSTTAQRENTIRVINCGSSSTYPSMTNAFDGTGLKTVLVGYVDSVAFVSAKSKAALPAISSSATLLYDTSDSNRRYSNYTGTEIVLNSSKFMGLINDVLGGLGISVNITSKTSSLKDKSGWCRYACVGSSNGLRYSTEFYLEFADANSTSDYHHSVNVVAVEGCTITTTPAQDATYKQTDDDKNVIATFYHKDSLTQEEVFRVSATLASGYKLSVTDASGNAVEYDAANDWYIMPNSNVTVTAVKA